MRAKRHDEKKDKWVLSSTLAPELQEKQWEREKESDMEGMAYRFLAGGRSNRMSKIMLVPSWDS